jgi:hypothetical protein
MLDRATSAMVAAVEIYNKPAFPHKVESFTILAINGWELLLKAKWLADHQNKERSLYVYERRQNKNGRPSKKRYIQRTRSDAPFTHGITHLSERLFQSKILDASAHRNIEIMVELRDCATHFYSHSTSFNVRVYEVAAACVKNFVSASHDWFDRQLSEFSPHLMPLAFIDIPKDIAGVVLNAEEKNFLLYLDGLDNPDIDPTSPYTVTVNIDIRFTRSKANDALSVRNTTELGATEVRLTEEQIRERYPWDYDTLTAQCRKRYSDFKANQKYHDIHKPLQKNEHFAKVRFLDPDNPKSAKKTFFNSNILNEMDKHYKKTTASVS